MDLHYFHKSPCNITWQQEIMVPLGDFKVSSMKNPGNPRSNKCNLPYLNRELIGKITNMAQILLIILERESYYKNIQLISTIWTSPVNNKLSMK